LRVRGLAGFDEDKRVAQRGLLRDTIVELEEFTKLVLGPHRALNAKRNAVVPQDDRDRIVGVRRSVVLVRRVEKHAGPGESKTTVRFRNVEDHLVLPRDLVEPRFELGVDGYVACGP